MQSFFSLDELLRQRLAADRRYLEFLRVPALSCGVYVLAAGAVDPQKPHTEDEVYYVIRGAARMMLGEEDRPVAPGDVIFVSARQEHRFHSITEELVMLVMFAPEESN
jgi:mannose-6-phosphate isomerase-like protein (cupin superfamily)